MKPTRANLYDQPPAGVSAWWLLVSWFIGEDQRFPNHSLQSCPFDAPFVSLKACSGPLTSAVSSAVSPEYEFYWSLFNEDLSDLPD
jgi:hypothetical protein